MLELKQISHIEPYSPSLTLACGMWFLLFDTIHAGDAYINMQILDGAIWAMLFLFVALFKMFALLRGKWRMNALACVIGFIFWQTVCLFVASSKPSSLVVPMSCFAGFLNLVRLFEFYKLRRENC